MPAKPLTREQVKEYVAGIETLVAEAGDRGRALVRSLVEHHGLSARMLDGQNIWIAMALQPPGTGGKPVKVETVATISTDDKIDLWVRGENGAVGNAPEFTTIDWPRPAGTARTESTEMWSGGLIPPGSRAQSPVGSRRR